MHERHTKEHRFRYKNCHQKVSEVSTMELEDYVVYKSNIAYHARGEFIKHQDHKKETVPNEASSYSKNNKSLNEVKTNSEFIRDKKLLIAMTLLIAVLVVTTLVAIIFSALSYRLSQANDESLTSFQIDEYIEKKLASLQVQSYCGAGQWHRIAFLNMSDPSQQCPPAWREYNTSGVRACGRTYSTVGNCSNVTYGTESILYSRVCGQVIGYQVGSPDAFNVRLLNSNITVGMDGVIITQLGIPHRRIWNLVGGLYEDSSLHTDSNCPCSPTRGRRSPPSIGSNYYCESGNPTDSRDDNQIYSDDPLWDGQRCEGTCCIGPNHAPWFSVQLPAPTTDMIEVSICADESTDNEDTPIKLLEIYVQ